MKTIKSLKDITTLEVDDVVVFGDLKYIVTQGPCCKRYYLVLRTEGDNDKIFKVLRINKIDFIEKLGINAKLNCPFPETISIEALTAVVSALFKEYEKQNELPKTWEEFCERNKMGDKRFCLYDGVIVGTGVSKNTVRDTILIESVEYAQAFRALMQLHQLRKAYVKNWEPNWDCVHDHYCIIVCQQKLIVRPRCVVSHTLSFPTFDLAEQFLTNFKDLLEVAKPLL